MRELVCLVLAVTSLNLHATRDDSDLEYAKILSRLEEVNHELHLGAVLPKVRKAILDHIAIGTPPEWVDAYEASLRFNLTSVAAHGPGLSAKRAQMHAIEVSQRRKTVAGVRREQEVFRLLLDRQFELAGADEHRRAEAPMVALARAEENGKISENGLKLLPYDEALDALSNATRAAGIEKPPEGMKRFALRLALRLLEDKYLHRNVESYVAVLKFALDPVDQAGLGLNLEDAHRYAEEVYQRRRSNGDTEPKTYRAILAKLLAPSEDQGFGMDSDHARAEAFRIVTSGDGFVSTSDEIERLDLRLAIIAFLTQPIREGGLGISHGETSALIPEWESHVTKMSQLHEFASHYGRALASILAKDALEGYEENLTRARDAALDWAQSTEDFKSLPTWLERRGLPPVELKNLDAYIAKHRSPVKIFFKRAARCVKALTT